MKRFESSRHLLQILKGCVLFEGVGELHRTHGANVVAFEAAIEMEMVMSSVAIDDAPNLEVKRFESSEHLLQILQRCVLLERVGKLLRTHGADLVESEAAIEIGMVMSSVAIDDVWAKFGPWFKAAMLPREGEGVINGY